MWFRVMTLATMFWLLAACMTTEPAPAATAVPIIVPTPPATAIATSVLPIFLPNEANQWVTYTDARRYFSLALPQQWHIGPPDSHAKQAVLAVANYDVSLTVNGCQWPGSLVRLTFSGWTVEPDQLTLDWIGTQMAEVQELEAVMNGRYAGYLVTTNHQRELVVRVTPDLIVQIQVTPESGWHVADVQSILNSLAAPEDEVDIPAVRPAEPVAVPGFCQDAAFLYAGPGAHFEEVGLLPEGESLAVTGRSHDGRWVKLFYPPASDSIAWARLSDMVVTAGELPIESTQVPPGNG